MEPQSITPENAETMWAYYSNLLHESWKLGPDPEVDESVLRSSMEYWYREHERLVPFEQVVEGLPISIIGD